MLQRTCLCAILFLATPLWSQVSSPGEESVNAPNAENRMLTPPVVSGQAYPVAGVSEERSNYLRGGVAFTTAYSDNVMGSSSGNPVSDISYSVWPTLAIDQTTSRVHWGANYAPGFTFYRHTSSRNQADQNASLNFQARLSPHVTIAAQDAFQKSSNFFNQPDLASAGAVSGGAQGPNQSVIAPLADRLSNDGNGGITYQFTASDMIGASGAFSRLYYPNPKDVSGLYDSSSQAGSGFYTHRVAEMHYFGASYQYQRLMSYPTQGQNETQTHALLLFYSFDPSKRFSISMFGGPQYAMIGPQFSAGVPFAQPGMKSWRPVAGASMNWQGQSASLAVSYVHTISGGGGLVGAVYMDSASASYRQQFTRSLSAACSGGYAQNKVVGDFPPTAAASTNGHSVSGTASLQRQFGEHLNLQLGYTRLHQSYNNVAVLSRNPDTNREWVSISYQFNRPLGR
jgi:hypothetical protein